MIARKRGRLERRGRATRIDIQTKAGRRRSGLLFRQGSRSRREGVVFQRRLLNARALISTCGKGSRGARSRLRRFERSCSWTVMIAEVDERRLACHRMVLGLVPPPARGRKGRTGVGSRNAAAKPCAGGGLPVKSAQAGGGSTRRWKALWPVEAAVFDEAAVEAGLASGEGWQGESPAGGHRVRQGRQRLRRQLGVRVRTPRPGDTAGGAVDRGTRQDRAVSRSRHARGLPRASRRDTMGVDSRSWRVAVKRCSTQVKPVATAAGGRTKRVARPVEAKPGIEQFAGCSCRRSVADIGETHLSRKHRGGPQGLSRRKRGSLKRPPDPLTGPEWIVASDKGAGLECASVKASAIRSTSAARSGSIRWKAPWFG